MNPSRLVFFALVTSTFVYAAISWSTLHEYAPMPFSYSVGATSTIVFYLLGALVWLAAFFMAGVVRRARGGGVAILTYAMLDGVAVLGLAAAFLHHDWRLYLAPWFFALAGFVRAAPED